jgi:hypothetical protein
MGILHSQVADGDRRKPMTDAEHDHVREQASADYWQVCKDASHKKSFAKLIERFTFDGVDLSPGAAKYWRGHDDPEAEHAHLQIDFEARQQGSADTKQAELDRAMARAEAEYERVKAEARAEYKRVTGEDHPDRS